MNGEIEVDPYVYLLTVGILLLVLGGFIAFMAHKQRLEEEAADAHDIPAE
jgi:uncharacterized membrane protein